MSIDVTEVINKISASIRVGGTVLGTMNPVAGACAVSLGEILPFIANRINKNRQDVFISSVESKIDCKKVLLYFKNNPEAYEQVLNTVRKAILSESNYTIFLMGKIVAIALNEDRIYTQNELQLVDALYRMNDYDFVNFMYLCNQFDELGQKSDDDVLLDESAIHDELDSTKDNILFTLKKLYSLNLFDYRSTAIFKDKDSNILCSSNFYKMNSLTVCLLEMLEKEVMI